MKSSIVDIITAKGSMLEQSTLCKSEIAPKRTTGRSKREREVFNLYMDNQALV